MDFPLFVQTIISGLSIGAVYALVALGYNVVYAATRVFNLAQGQVLMVGVLVTWELREAWGVPTVLAVAGAALVAAAVNVLIELVAVAPLRSARGVHGVAGIASLITTLGASTIILNLAIKWWGPDTRPFTRYFPLKGIQFGDVTIQWQSIFMIVTAGVIVYGYHLWTTHTRWGVGLEAMSEDTEAAAMRGVPVKRGRMLAFAVAGLISGLGGAAIGPIAFANPALGFGFGLKGFAAIAIGGFGSTTGALVGGGVLGLTEAFCTTYWNDQYRPFAALALVLVVLLLRPRGLLGNAALREV